MSSFPLTKHSPPPAQPSFGSKTGKPPYILIEYSAHGDYCLHRREESYRLENCNKMHSNY